MNSNNSSNIEKEELNYIKSKDKLGNLKNNFFLQKVFKKVTKKKALQIIKYNKKIQQRINININDYKKYSFFIPR